MAKVQQNINDLEGYLLEQINFLQMSATSYDKGFTGEAKRLAVAIRVLVHDTNKSQSLLKQLGKKEIGFFNTSTQYDPRNRSSFHGLTIIGVSPSGPVFLPRLEHTPHTGQQFRYIPFQDWWSYIVIVDIDKNEFSRRDIVQTLSNKEGGAHVDPQLDQIYANLSRGGSIGWRRIKNNSVVEPVELATMRQIAFEMLKSLEMEFPNFF